MEADRRRPYAAQRGEGENACVIGPSDEIVVEITHGDPEQQMLLAQNISTMLNYNFPPTTCADAGDVARYTLLLTERNCYRDHDTIETVHQLAIEAGGNFARERLGSLSSDEVPF